MNSSAIETAAVPELFCCLAALPSEPQCPLQNWGHPMLSPPAPQTDSCSDIWSTIQDLWAVFSLQTLGTQLVSSGCHCPGQCWTPGRCP